MRPASERPPDGGGHLEALVDEYYEASGGDPRRLKLLKKQILDLVSDIGLDLALRLDALHLASADFLRTSGVSLEIATYDERMRGAAQTMGFALVGQL